jgi:hypothetical protein
MQSNSSFTGKAIVAILGMSVIFVACWLVLLLTKTKADGRGTAVPDMADQGGIVRPEYAEAAKRSTTRAKADVSRRSVELSVADGRTENESNKRADNNAAPRAPSGQEIIDVQQKAFSAERSDPSWSDKASRQVVAALTEHLPEGSSLKSVECRTTMCSLQLQHKDTDSYHNFVRSTLLGADTGLWGGAFSAIITNEAQGDIRAHVFLAREGHGLPQPAPESAN